MTQPGCIAVLNAGSSSIKFALYEAGHDGALLFRGQVEDAYVTPARDIHRSDPPAQGARAFDDDGPLVDVCGKHVGRRLLLLRI